MKSSLILVLAVIGLLVEGAARPQDQSAAQHFVRGRELIEANGVDSMGSTRKGFEEGLAEVRKAIELGYPDKAAAYKLLANAYNTLALFYAKPDSEEQKRAFLLQKQALEKLLELKPDDPRIRADYARAVKDQEMETAAWRDVVASEPNDAEARWFLGVLLVHNGQIDEGMTHLKKMVELANLYLGQIYVEGARSALIEKGRKAEAAEIARLMERKKDPFLLPRQTVEKLSALTPGEGRMRAELAKVVKDAKVQIGQLQNILAGAPTNSRAMFSLAMVLIYNGQIKEGVMYVERVLGSVDPKRQQIYGRVAQNFLIEEGKKSEAAEVAKLIANKRPKPN